MSPAFLLDTNILAEPLRPVPNPAIMLKLKEFESQLAIPAVVWHEMWFGCHRLQQSPRRKAIEKYLLEVVVPSMPILPYDTAASEYHAEERARLSLLGKTPSFADGQIAAIAHANGLTVVTLNLSDFQEFRDLQIEDWQA